MSDKVKGTTKVNRDKLEQLLDKKGLNNASDMFKQLPKEKIVEFLKTYREVFNSPEPPSKEEIKAIKNLFKDINSDGADYPENITNLRISYDKRSKKRFFTKLKPFFPTPKQLSIYVSAKQKLKQAEFTTVSRAQNELEPERKALEEAEKKLPFFNEFYKKEGVEKQCIQRAKSLLELSQEYENDINDLFIAIFDKNNISELPISITLLPDTLTAAKQFVERDNNTSGKYQPSDIQPVMDEAKKYILNSNIRNIYGHIKPIREIAKEKGLAGTKNTQRNWIKDYADQAGLKNSK